MEIGQSGCTSASASTPPTSTARGSIWQMARSGNIFHRRSRLDSRSGVSSQRRKTSGSGSFPFLLRAELGTAAVAGSRRSATSLFCAGKRGVWCDRSSIRTSGCSAPASPTPSSSSTSHPVRHVTQSASPPVSVNKMRERCPKRLKVDERAPSSLPVSWWLTFPVQDNKVRTWFSIGGQGFISLNNRTEFNATSATDVYATHFCSLPNWRLVSTECGLLSTFISAEALISFQFTLLT